MTIADERQYAADAEDFVLSHLLAFERGRIDDWASDLAANGVFIPADPGRAFTSREAMAAQMHGDFDEAIAEGLKVGVETQRIDTGATADGAAAWCNVDALYTAAHGGDAFSVPWRLSSVLAQTDEGWQVVIEHYARVVSGREIFDRAASGRLPNPAALPSVMGATGSEVRDALQRALGGGSRTLTTEGAIGMGPRRPDCVTNGRQVVRMLSDLRDHFGAIVLRDAETCVAVAPVGASACIAANGDSHLGGRRESQIVPWRVTAAYVRQGGGWRLAQIHLSIGVSDDEVANDRE